MLGAVSTCVIAVAASPSGITGTTLPVRRPVSPPAQPGGAPSPLTPARKHRPSRVCVRRGPGRALSVLRGRRYLPALHGHTPRREALPSDARRAGGRVARGRRARCPARFFPPWTAVVPGRSVSGVSERTGSYCGGAGSSRGTPRSTFRPQCRLIQSGSDKWNVEKFDPVALACPLFRTATTAPTALYLGQRAEICGLCWFGRRPWSGEGPGGIECRFHLVQARQTRRRPAGRFVPVLPRPGGLPGPAGGKPGRLKAASPSCRRLTQNRPHLLTRCSCPPAPFVRRRKMLEA